jgi:GntR family transcriptional regulator
MLGDRMMMASTRFSTKPLYLQLRDALADRIASGEWRPGSAIPNESDLAREFEVSAGTMRKALDLMEGEHLLTRRQGRGTFVNDQSSHELAARFSNIRCPDGRRICGDTKSVQITSGAANETERKRLHLSAQDSVFRIQRVRHDAGEVFQIEEASLPAALFPGLDEKKDSAHRIVVLAQDYGILPGKAEERIALGEASAKVAEALGIAAGSPVIVLDRLVLALDGRPIEWRVAWCNLTDKYYMAEMN